MMRLWLDEEMRKEREGGKKRRSDLCFVDVGGKELGDPPIWSVHDDKAFWKLMLSIPEGQLL